jgi:hypothetical protein
MTKKTHLRRGRLEDETGLTLCGRSAARVTLIGRNEVVDAATCKACQRADDAAQIRDLRRAERAAGVKPGEWF